MQSEFALTWIEWAISIEKWNIREKRALCESIFDF